VAEGQHEAFVHAAGEVGVVDFGNAVVAESATSALARAVCAAPNQNITVIDDIIGRRVARA